MLESLPLKAASTAIRSRYRPGMGLSSSSSTPGTTERTTLAPAARTPPRDKRRTTREAPEDVLDDRAVQDRFHGLHGGFVSDSRPVPETAPDLQAFQDPTDPGLPPWTTILAPWPAGCASLPRRPRRVEGRLVHGVPAVLDDDRPAHRCPSDLRPAHGGCLEDSRGTASLQAASAWRQRDCMNERSIGLAIKGPPDETAPKLPSCRFSRRPSRDGWLPGSRRPDARAWNI
jgi:hypothetical protein